MLLMLVTALGCFLLLILARVRASGPETVQGLGLMSEQWLAELIASHSA